MIVFENWCIDQAEVKSSLRIRRRVLHIQHFCIDVLGDTTFGFWCQYVPPRCDCISHHLLIPGQVREEQWAIKFLWLWLLEESCC